MPKINERKSAEHWYSLSVLDVFGKLKTDKNGLTEKQVKTRREIHGYNLLPKERSASQLLIFLNQLNSPLVYILIVGGSISVLLNHLTDATVIFLTIAINTAFGFWQENKANNAVAKLKEIVKQQARVLRDGHEVEIESSELILGDIVFLTAGDKVPADCRIIDSNDLQIIEAALTGESAPSSKNSKVLKVGTDLADRENMAYMGTQTVRGKGTAVVVAVGVKTEIGQIAQLIKETKEEITPLQQKMLGLSRSLAILVVGICIFVFTLGIFLGNDPVTMFMIAIALSAAAIPEGMIVSITIVLTLGMQFILKKKALVRKLVAAETLGSVSVICTDKTGTLTEGKMSVFKIITADNEYNIFGKKLTQIEKVHDLISKISILCSSAVVENPQAVLAEMKMIGTPTEKALLSAAMEMGYDQEKLKKDYEKLDEIPFNSEQKFMATLHNHKNDKHHHIFAKGAPEIIMDFCNQVMINGQAEKMDINKMLHLKKKYEAMTSKGLRVLAFAYKSGNFKKTENELHDLVFLGFMALKDPLRPEAKETINLCRRSGIRTVILTGDHKLTAKAIFNELGLKINGNIVEGKELDNWSDEELQKKVKTIDVYARVEPRHKIRVVEALQKNGEVVAMTGDGINDAPALKKADIGIALGDGTDVTKETADLILLDNNFSVIVAAVEQGRIIFDNIRKVVSFLLAHTFSEMILIVGSLLAGLPLPLLATQILWINLINDGLPSIAMTMEPGDKNIMKQKPRPRGESILNYDMKVLIFGIGIISDIFLLGLFVFLLRILGEADLNYIRTLIFALLCLDAFVYSYSVRKLNGSVFSQNPFDNWYLIGAVLISIGLLLVAVYWPIMQVIFYTVPLSANDWLIVVALTLLKFMLISLARTYFVAKKSVKPKKIKIAYAR